MQTIRNKIHITSDLSTTLNMFNKRSSAIYLTLRPYSCHSQIECLPPTILSNNIRILAPNKGHLRERKGHSAEKTPFFEVFRKMLTDKWLHEFKTVNGRFTKSKFAKGIVSSCERYRFVVRKDMFEAMKHGLWRGQSLPFAVRKLVFREMKNDE